MKPYSLHLRSLKRGLTMMEVVISLGILVFIGTITWQTISGSLMLREILEYEDNITRSARVAIGQIKKELRVAFLTSNKATNNELHKNTLSYKSSLVLVVTKSKTHTLSTL